MNSFSLHLVLGNDAMQTPDDLARSLEALAAKVRARGLEVGTQFFVLDENGNQVGVASVKEVDA